MKKIITEIFVIAMLYTFCGSIFAATATCTASNKTTYQTFSASGDGATQAAASQEAENTVMQICKQGSSSSPDDCQVDGCASN